MDIHSRLREHKPLLDTLGSTNRADSLGCLELVWPPIDMVEWIDRVFHRRDPGVAFLAATRLFVLEEHSGELRFHAGGRSDAVSEAPNESGVFPSIGEALAYPVAFLVDELNPRDIGVQRVHSAHGQ